MAIGKRELRKDLSFYSRMNEKARGDDFVHLSDVFFAECSTEC